MDSRLMDSRITDNRLTDSRLSRLTNSQSNSNNILRVTKLINNRHVLHQINHTLFFKRNENL